MAGQKIGYIRVSSFDQNADRQLEGLSLDRVFIDKSSGKDNNRPQLELMLSYARQGDTVIVHSMDRLARNLDNLRQIVKSLTFKSVKISFVKECLTFTGEDSPMSNLLLNLMGSFAEFERSLIKERQREGIALAKKRGAYTGRKPALNAEEIVKLKDRVAIGIAKAKVAREFKITRETLYTYLNK